jgi:hypothetical protein
MHVSSDPAAIAPTRQQRVASECQNARRRGNAGYGQHGHALLFGKRPRKSWSSDRSAEHADVRSQRGEQRAEPAERIVSGVAGRDDRSESAMRPGIVVELADR